MQHSIGTVIAALSIMFVTTASFINHIVVCVERDLTALLIVGIFFPPIGVIHGFGAFFGLWG